MNTQQNRYSGPCTETKSPEVFYGYCHDSHRMRMMDYNDYVGNVQKGYTNLYQSPTSALQQMVDMAQATTTTAPAPASQHRGKHHGCNCHEDNDCGCNCCIRCADTVEYARCGETRKILITFDNDSRRERQVTLEFGSFLTDSGQQLPWKGSLSDTTFTLSPCGEKTVAITVSIDCGQSTDTNDPAGTVRVNAAALDSCKVGYATLKADGCLIRPIVVAVAVLPDRCGAHRIGCLCGCC